MHHMQVVHGRKLHMIAELLYMNMQSQNRSPTQYVMLLQHDCPLPGLLKVSV